MTPNYLSTNQSEERPYPVTLSLTLSLINLSLKALGEFGPFEPSCWTPCLVPCNPHCTFLHHNLVSVDWLCCNVGERTQVWFGNRTKCELFNRHNTGTVMTIKQNTSSKRIQR